MNPLGVLHSMRQITEALVSFSAIATMSNLKLGDNLSSLHYTYMKGDVWFFANVDYSFDKTIRCLDLFLSIGGERLQPIIDTKMEGVEDYVISHWNSQIELLIKMIGGHPFPYPCRKSKKIMNYHDKYSMLKFDPELAFNVLVGPLNTGHSSASYTYRGDNDFRFHAEVEKDLRNNCIRTTQYYVKIGNADMRCANFKQQAGLEEHIRIEWNRKMNSLLSNLGNVYFPGAIASA